MSDQGMGAWTSWEMALPMSCKQANALGKSDIKSKFAGHQAHQMGDF